jgi:hypothetical protein
MTGLEQPTVVVFDERVLWHLAGGTAIREVGAHGREFTIDDHRPGRIWHGHTPCHVSALEMPVEVMGR